jgi:hypothetical protein
MNPRQCRTCAPSGRVPPLRSHPLPPVALTVHGPDGVVATEIRTYSPKKSICSSSTYRPSDGW